MIDIKKMKSIIQEEIGKSHNLGEHAGSSGHLAYRSIINFKLSEPKEVEYKGTQAYEVTCKYDIYTETEFLHDPDDDEDYTEHYQYKFILDKDSKILAVEGLDS